MSNSDGLIRSYVDRILRLKDEVKAVNDDIREVYAEASALGVDKTLLGLRVRDAWQTGQGCTIYFAAFHRSKLLKIGISRDVPRRLAALAATKGEKPELLNSFPGIFAIEGWFHAAFSEWRVTGEWFELTEASALLATRAVNPLFAGD